MVELGQEDNFDQLFVKKQGKGQCGELTTVVFTAFTQKQELFQLEGKEKF